MLEGFKIVVLSVLAAIVYGVLHDQVTARVCIEYFTVGHPPVFATTDPTLLALGWGVIATWWVGLLLGIPLVLAARVGARPALRARDLVRSVLVLLGCMALASLVAGVVGWSLARAGAVVLVEPLAGRLPAEWHVPFIADLWAHLAAYAVGFTGGAAVCVTTWRRRAAAHGR